jgi:predicted double-glycine peptidase
MLLEALVTLGLGIFCFRGGTMIGRLLLRQGATANDLFKGKNNAAALLFIGIYVAFLVLALNIPQMQVFPLTWRVYGMQTTWTIMRVMLIGFCGAAVTIVAQTARKQVFIVLLLGLIGVGGFTTTEAYFLAPIHQDLFNNLQPNGVFKQTSMSSCAPSALATVLQRWGIKEATETSVAKLASTSRMGTSMPQVIVAARGFNLNGIELSPTWEQMRQINRPGVLGVWLIDGDRKLSHAVALLAMNADKAAIGDPSSGKIYVLDRTEFAQIWREQYIPIFRPNEVLLLTNIQAVDYLKRLGYLQQASQDFKSALQEFQRSAGVKDTGNLDTQTSLLLMGSFLEGVPTLKEFSID